MSKRERVVVIGGSSGMGLEVARKLLAAGAEVMIAGRSGERLATARAALGADRVETATVDIGERSQVAALFARLGRLNHLVVTAADLPYGPAVDLTEADLMRAVRSKLLGPLFAAQESAARLEPGGSVTFTSGIAARRPVRGPPPRQSTAGWKVWCARWPSSWLPSGSMPSLPAGPKRLSGMEWRQ
jgi:NAD(P)-dependent dehydrogenase (short-subunit alcohol dehydrogenase family)